MKKDDKLDETLRELQKELDEKYGNSREKMRRRRVKRNKYQTAHTFYNKHYVARMYQQAKEAAEYDTIKE